MRSIPWHSAVKSLLCAVLVMAAAPVWGDAPGRITAVTVSPDGKQVAIRHDGPGGTHNAFVLTRPSRLVVDFEGMALGPVARTIPVNGPFIKEVRLGYSGTRARVVLDLGDLAVPVYRTQKEDNRVVVALGSPSVPVSSLLKKKNASIPGKPASVGPLLKTPTPSTKKSPLVALKSAGVSGDLIVLEVAEVKDPNRSCRLVLELDMDRLRVRRATMSDQKGRVESQEIAPENPNRQSPGEPPTVSRGPRRGPISQMEEEFPKPAVRWGLPTVKRIGPRLSRNVQASHEVE